MIRKRVDLGPCETCTWWEVPAGEYDASRAYPCARAAARVNAAGAKASSPAAIQAVPMRGTEGHHCPCHSISEVTRTPRRGLPPGGRLRDQDGDWSTSSVAWPGGGGEFAGAA
jgi:hypothetical protein